MIFFLQHFFQLFSHTYHCIIRIARFTVCITFLGMCMINQNFWFCSIQINGKILLQQIRSVNKFAICQCCRIHCIEMSQKEIIIHQCFFRINFSCRDTGQRFYIFCSGFTFCFCSFTIFLCLPDSFRILPGHILQKHRCIFLCNSLQIFR